MEELNLDFNDLRVGDTVEGTVVSVEERVIYLDVNTPTEGKMYLNYYTKDKSVTKFYGLVNVGDKILCTVTKSSEDKDGGKIIMLSRLNQLSLEKAKEIEAAMEANTPILVSVDEELEKGYKCSFNGVNGIFLPKSLAADAAKGAKIEVMVVECNAQRNNYVVSRRAITDAEIQAKKEAEYDAINVGDVLTGTIIKVEKYGALVKFNNVVGFLKSSQYSYEFVNLPEVLKENDSIEVKVMEKSNGKLDLSRKALIDSPFNLYLKAHKKAEKVTGKIVSKLQFGFILELAPGVRGLLHRNEFSHNPNDNFVNSVSLGDDVEVAILDINEAAQKISLSRKALIDNPWEKVDAKVGDLVDVKITDVNEKGLLVDALGVEGIVPYSDAIEEKGKKLSDYYAVGDTTKAVITEIRPRFWKLVLSIRKYQDAEERKNYENHMVDEEEAATIGDSVKLD